MSVRPLPIRIVVCVMVPIACAIWSLFWSIAVPQVNAHTIPYYFLGLVGMSVGTLIAHLVIRHLAK